MVKRKISPQNVLLIMNEIQSNVGFYKIWQEYYKVQVKFLKNKEVDFFGLQLGHMSYLLVVAPLRFAWPPYRQ